MDVKELLTMTSTTNMKRGKIANFSFDRLHDMYSGDTLETLIGLVDSLGYPPFEKLPVKIRGFEGVWHEDGLILHGTTSWKNTLYNIKIAFIFNAGGEPDKVGGIYEMEVDDERDIGKD